MRAIQKRMPNGGIIKETIVAMIINNAHFIPGVLTDIGTAGKIIILGHRPENVSKRARKIIKNYR